ncbi:MAG: DJ-1/PfpI family protein [Burkholderiaceae bacterium]
MSIRFAVFIYPGTEPIDLATFGVLSMARRIDPEIQMHVVAERAGEVALANGLRVLADYGFDDWPGADVLIITGGPGWPEQSKHEPTLAFVQRAALSAKVAAVCTGGMILAASGLLDGKQATTKRRNVPPEKSPLALLKSMYPNVEVVETGWVDSGNVMTGGGVSLCIDATLNLLKRFCGDSVATETAQIIEYDRAYAANAGSFAKANE